MKKFFIYSIGLAMIGGVMGYSPDFFRDPVNFCLGALFLILLRFVAAKFGRD